MADDNMPDTMLIQTKVRGADKPDGYFAATFQNAYYKILFHYMEQDYQRHKSNSDFKPSDIHIAILSLKDNIPQITCVLSDDKAHAISIDAGLLCSVIFENEIDDYMESLKAAKQTIRQLKDIIRRYFGEDMV